MDNIKLYYSDTDSLILSGPLDESIVGNGLGQWKLEAEVEEGIFVRPKLYAYYTNKKEGILKKVAAGVDSDKLTYKDSENMAKGEAVTTQNFEITVNWRKLQVESFIKQVTLQKKRM